MTKGDMWDKVIGIFCVGWVAAAAISSASSIIVSHANWWGLLLAVGALTSGCIVGASVIRDRL